jgi:hypothetical protein
VLVARERRRPLPGHVAQTGRVAVSAQPARHLHVVSDRVADDNGEVVSPEALVAEIEKLRVDLKMAQRDVKSKNRRISELERDKVAERLKHPDRELILRICKYWHRKCRGGDPRVKPDSPDRFDAVAALVEMEHIVADGGRKRRERVYPPEAFKEAIDGAAFDHFVKARKNGSEQHYDDLELIARSAAKFDEFRARAPKPAPRPPEAGRVRDGVGARVTLTPV